MSSFFIDRPIFAWVIAIVIMLAGLLSVFKLPVTHYPNIAAPAISVNVTYPGASAQTVQDSVVQVIEQQLNGLDGLRYMTSTSEANGSMSIIITFDQGVDPDIAQVQVQNKLQVATPLLPEEVRREGIRVAKYQSNFMLVIGLIDESGQMDNFDLGNYIASNLRDPVSRVQGVGDFLLFGSQYAMRIWLDPTKLYSYQLTPGDVANAVRSQNVQVSAGQLAGLPSKEGVQLNATITAKTRLKTVEEFEDILLKVNPDGSQVRIKDVAEVNLGSENFSISGKYNGVPASAMALRLVSGGNVLETTERVKALIDELSVYFPQGVKAVYPLETAPVVAESISSVVKTLVEAIVLVFLVMYLFLQNFRATLIPTLAVPVVLLGTFAVLLTFGFNINVLTMYAMVLAIGLLVDDAIVVVENVERVMTEENLNVKEATRKSMKQIQGALVGIGMVLTAVFVPMAFFGGSAGVIYQQFSITIVTAMVLSVLVALIFTPALCVTLLRAKDVDHSHKRGFFGWFNRTFLKGTQEYERAVTSVLKRRARYLLIFIVIVGCLGVLFAKLPKAFLADEDQGIMFVLAQLPSNATAQRTDEVMDEIERHLREEEPGLIKSVFTVTGFSFTGKGQNMGMAFVHLKPWDEREGEVTDIFSLAQRSFAAFGNIKDAFIVPVVPPAIFELGNALGFDLFLQDRAGLGHQILTQAKDEFLAAARSDQRLTQVLHSGMDDAPKYEIIVDEEKASAFKLDLNDINETIQAAWGSMYVNDFIDRGRVKRVYIQGDVDSRMAPEDFAKWYVRNSDGDMVPFSAFSHGQWGFGPAKLVRYNGIPAMEILGAPAPGYSTGDAMAALEEHAKNLPLGIGMSYTGLSLDEIETGSQVYILYALSILVVFLCLAALYESWSIPLAVMLVVPLGLIGTVSATLLRGLSNDIFFQVGLLTTVGLAARNAILIVEFARSLHETEGLPLVSAAIKAARLRLRPILMTSLAFTFGVLPMALATGAGQGSQHSIATGVVGGMITATVLAIFFIPLFFVVVSQLSEKLFPKKQEETGGKSIAGS
ncbi:MAG: efflux RND transporter permease subunit [Porticoccaceae bacterium]